VEVNDSLFASPNHGCLNAKRPVDRPPAFGSRLDAGKPDDE
jgi:hypothetical protein